MPVVSSTVTRAANVELVIQQGTDFSHIISLKNSDGSIFPLTGYSARMQIRPYASSATVLEDMTSGNGKITINGAAGQLTLVLSNIVTSAYTWRSGVYDVEIISSGNVVTRVMEGNIALSLEVTR